MKITKSIVAIGLMLATGLVACNSGSMRRNPGKTYAPDMTYSRAYDAYTSNPNFSDSMSSRPPVMGTIARGHSLPDHLVEGDTNAYKAFTTTMKFTDDELREGGRLFNIYCGICHGSNLDGQGPLYTSGKFAAMPANFMGADKLHMSVGQMYAAVKYGKGQMGSYASQIDIKQRWQIIAYIKQKQAGADGGDAFTMGMGAKGAGSDTAKRATTADTPKTEAETAANLKDAKEHK